MQQPNQNASVPRVVPPLPATLNAIRMTYMSLFNQILDNSININCICKTTQKYKDCSNSNKTTKNQFDSKVLDTNKNEDFMSDETENNQSSEFDDKNENDVEMTDSLNENDTRLFELDYANQVNENDKTIRLNRICDLSCFENMRYVHFVLKNCFHQVNEQNLDEKVKKFDHLWSNFKFLSRYPKSCDYYGTTVFHYAAADNNYELLKYSLQKYPNGVFCIDSKGMTPLMRAVQRNNLKCVQFLLNNTDSNLNGSSHTTYTPLWFAVSNGYTDLALLLLNHNASPSIVDKSTVNNSQSVAELNTLIHTEDSSGIYREPNDTLQQASSTYLFSPLRASIVYSRFEIMIYLLEFNANVYELFGACQSSSQLTRPNRTLLKSKLNEDYVNSLKFFHRQFSQTQAQLNELINNNSDKEKEKVDYDVYLCKLNDFIENSNVYRRMFIEFVKSIIFKLNSNLNLVDRFYYYLNSINKNSIDYIMKMTNLIDAEESDFELSLNWNDYVNLIVDFMDSLDSFLSLDPDNLAIFNSQLSAANSSRLKTMYHRNLLDFSLVLMDRFFKPKTLKELCRFSVRKSLFKIVEKENLKYENEFLKQDHLIKGIDNFKLPTYLKQFLLHKN